MTLGDALVACLLRQYNASGKTKCSTFAAWGVLGFNGLFVDVSLAVVARTTVYVNIQYMA